MAAEENKAVLAHTIEHFNDPRTRSGYFELYDPDAVLHGYPGVEPGQLPGHAAATRRGPSGGSVRGGEHLLRERNRTSPRASIFIDRSPEDVFRYLVELNDAEWRSGGVIEMKLTSESYEGVGATHVEARKMMGRRIETRAEAVIYEPNRRWAVRRASGPVRPQVTYTLEPAEEGTRLTFEFDVPALRGAARVLRPLVRIGAPIVERATVKDLERLKERLERDQSKEVDRG